VIHLTNLVIRTVLRLVWTTTRSSDNDAIKRLGIELPEAGEQFIVLGVGPVVRVSQTDNKRGKNRSLSIQLQKIEVGPVSTGAIKNAVDAVSAGIKQADGD